MDTTADVRCAPFTATLTVAVVEEVGDGGRRAAAPGLGGVDGGEDGGHEPLVAVHPEALLAELGVVVRQAEEVTCGGRRKDAVETEAKGSATGSHATNQRHRGVTSDGVNPYLSHGRR